MRILIVEDDARIADVVRRTLAEAGYAADARHTAADGLEAFAVADYDLVILDVMLAEEERGGFDVCRAIRAADASVPILMLTALNKIRSKVEGLDSGADDYLVKPVHVLELLARVRALLRRAPRADLPILEAQGVRLDPASREVTRDGRAIALTAKEFAVLEYLMRNAGRVVSATELIDHAWDGNYEGYSNVVQTYVRYLRQKLNAHGEPDLITTRRGAGYVVAVNP
ncbi:response regulator transcription factor [Demequina sp.]|uniref:response regulator transcription factor n=1 Tax=Demequina sp. TaxID=2050685 RepID=UPI0025DF21BE|nr:response regulator transcription factor [Demequina sp.]